MASGMGLSRSGEVVYCMHGSCYPDWVCDLSPVKTHQRKEVERWLPVRRSDHTARGISKSRLSSTKEPPRPWGRTASGRLPPKKTNKENNPTKQTKKHGYV